MITAGPTEWPQTRQLTALSPGMGAAAIGFDEPSLIRASSLRTLLHCRQAPNKTAVESVRDVPLERLQPASVSGVPTRRFEVLQQWEGTVTDADDDTFWADLRDLTTPSSPTEIVEVPVAEIAVSDRTLLQPGSVFYWSVGYETTPGGQIRRVSEIRLRRTPMWTQRGLDSVRLRGQQLFEQFCGDLDDATSPR